MNLHRDPGFIRRVANVFQQAIHALGLAGNAELASMPDYLMRKQNPLFPRNDLHQVLLDLLRILLSRERSPVVSTTTPPASLNQVPSTTFAVFRATPGRVRSFSMSRGTSPPNSATIFFAAPT